MLIHLMFHFLGSPFFFLFWPINFFTCTNGKRNLGVEFGAQKIRKKKDRMAEKKIANSTPPKPNIAKKQKKAKKKKQNFQTPETPARETGLLSRTHTIIFFFDLLLPSFYLVHYFSFCCGKCFPILFETKKKLICELMIIALSCHNTWQEGRGTFVFV